MGQPWENPQYGNERRRRRRIILFISLGTIVGSLFWIWQRHAPPDMASPHATETSSRFRSAPLSSPPQPSAAARETAVDHFTEFSFAAADPNAKPGAARHAADALFIAGDFQAALEAYRRLAPTDPFSRGRAGLCLAQLGRWSEAIAEVQSLVDAQPGDFSARQWLAQALYRQNELELALVHVQAALELREDGELLELQARLQKEILVQRHYDDARTADFVVLFDGYEHDDIKREVLDILKSAHAEIGKELDHFPEQPVTVILYTTRDFSDVTSAPQWVSGMFGKIDGKIRLPVQGTAGHEQALRRVLYHEYTHALLFSLAPGCPLWLHEGLAQFFSGDRPVQTGQVIPLALLNNGFPNEPRAAVAAYMESLQAVVDLLGEHGMPRLRRLLAKLGDGSDLETAFAAVYGQPFSRWAKNWRPLPQAE
ncbi:MAG TPA: tetratricopeptide repeat protein [Candidatus Binatia bacterium]|nr:tetratricopeptide repeat protein [Candidatus Binatia bacterium]